MYLFEKELSRESHNESWKNLSGRKNLKYWSTSHSKFDNLTIPRRSVLHKLPSKHCRTLNCGDNRAYTFSLNPLQKDLRMLGESDQSFNALNYKSTPLRHTFNGLQSPRFGKEDDDTGVNECDTFLNEKDDTNFRNSNVLLANTQRPTNQTNLSHSSISARLSALQSQTLSGNNVETFQLSHQVFGNDCWDVTPNNALVKENNVLHPAHSFRDTFSNSSLPFHHLSSGNRSLHQKQQETHPSLMHFENIAQVGQGSQIEIKSVVDKVPHLDLTSRGISPFSFQNWGPSTNLKYSTNAKLTLAQNEDNHSNSQKVAERNTVGNFRRFNENGNNDFSDSLSPSNPLLEELQELKAMMSSIVTERELGSVKNTNVMADNGCKSQDDHIENQAFISKDIELLSTESSSRGARETIIIKKKSPRYSSTAPSLPKKAPASPPSRKAVLLLQKENLNSSEPINKNYSGVFDSAYMKDAQKFLEDECEENEKYVNYTDNAKNITKDIFHATHVTINNNSTTFAKENDKKERKTRSPRQENIQQEECSDTKGTPCNQMYLEEGSQEEEEFEKEQTVVKVQKQSDTPQERDIQIKYLDAHEEDERKQADEEDLKDEGEQDNSQDDESHDEETEDEESENEESEEEESEDEESGGTKNSGEEESEDFNEETSESVEETSDTNEGSYELDEESCEGGEECCESDHETCSIDEESSDLEALSPHSGFSRNIYGKTSLNDRKKKNTRLRNQKSKRVAFSFSPPQQMKKKHSRVKTLSCSDSKCERLKCDTKIKQTGKRFNVAWSPQNVSYSTKDQKRSVEKRSDSLQKCDGQNRPRRYAKCLEHDLQRELALNNKLLLRCLKKASQGHENEHPSILSNYIQMRNINGVDIPVLLIDACKLEKEKDIAEEQVMPNTLKGSSEKASLISSQTQEKNLIALLEKKNDELTSDILKLKEERQFLESQSQILKNEKEVLENDLHTLKERVTDLEKTIKDSQEKIESYKIQIDITKNESRETRETLSMDVAKIRESRDELQNLLCVQENHMKAAHAGLDKLQEERQRLLRELTALERLDADKSSIIDKLNAEVRTCKEECEKLNAQVQQTENIIVQLRDENKDLSKRVSIYEQEKEKFEEDRQSLLQKMSKGMSFEEKQELLELVQLHQQKYEKTQEEIQRLKKEVEASVSTRVQFEKELLETTQEMESALQVAKEKIRNAETEKLQALAREKVLLAEKENLVKFNKSHLCAEKEELKNQVNALQRELEETKSARRDAELKAEHLKKKTQEIQDDQMSMEKLCSDNENMKLKIMALSKSKKILEQDLKSTLQASRGLHQKLMQLQASNMIVDAEEGKRLRQCEKEWENYQLAAKRKKCRIKRHSVLSLQFSPSNSLLLNKGVQIGPPFSLSSSLLSESRSAASADRKNIREKIKRTDLSPTSPSSSNYSRSLSNSSQSSARSYTGGSLQTNVVGETRKHIGRKVIKEITKSSSPSKEDEQPVPQFQKPTQSFVMRRQQSLMKHARVDDICVRGLHRVEPCTNVFRRNRRNKYEESSKSSSFSPKPGYARVQTNQTNNLVFEGVNSSIEEEGSSFLESPTTTDKQNERSSSIRFKENIENPFNTFDEEKSCETFFLSENKTIQNTQHYMKEKNRGVSGSVQGAPQRLGTHPLNVSVEQENDTCASFQAKSIEDCTPFHLKNCDFQKVVAPTIETPDFGSHSAFQCSTTFLDVSTKKSNVDSLRQKLLNEGILSTENLV